jgi:hypothetical protein
VLAQLAAFDDRRPDLAPVALLDAQLDDAVREQQPIAGPDVVRGPTNVVEMRPAVPGKLPVTISSASPGLTVNARPPSSSPVRILGPLRSCSSATLRPAAAASARMRATTCPCASCEPCEKLRRKTSTPAPMRSRSAASLLVAGPTVAMIFVRRMRRLHCTAGRRWRHFRRYFRYQCAASVTAMPSSA